MDDAPDPANDDEHEEELQDAEQEGSHVEFVASAGRHHSADARGERNAVQHQAHEGSVSREAHNSGLAS